MYLGDYTEDYADLNFKFTSRTTTGVPTTLAGSPVISVYVSNEDGTEKTSAEAYITLTVDFDSVTGVNHVKIDLSGDAFFAVAKDYQVVVTTGTVGGVSVVGETVATFSIENRFDEVDVTKLNGSAANAVLLSAAAGTMETGTVDNDVAPSATVFEADDITEATTDHFKDRVILFTSGTLLKQAKTITGYVLNGANGQFTCNAFTEAPANDDTFIIV